jgi:hypothetical protein
MLTIGEIIQITQPIIYTILTMFREIKKLMEERKGFSYERLLFCCSGRLT